ncbi:MAG: transcriptional repressor LexA [Geobacter sp.]|nr:transcriptional repressor LexA [Geobacter sp.]
MEQLTPRQHQVLEIVGRFIADYGYPPSLRQIAEQLGVNGTLGIMKHLTVLEKKGYLRRQGGSSRGIVLAGQTSQAVSLPVVGTVRAGQPQPASEDIEEYFAIDRSQQKSGGAFFLRVRGDSMINACITDGDLALIRPQATAENRDIVVALVDGEATLKRFYRERGQVRLQPENPNLEPIIVREGEELLILGKVVGIYRQLA